MSNMKIIYDCTAKTTSYVPLSGAEIKEREEAAKKYAQEKGKTKSEVGEEDNLKDSKDKDGAIDAEYEVKDEKKE